MAANQGRRSRVAALQALYEWDVARHPLQECLERQLQDRVEGEVADFTRSLVNGVAENLATIDATISGAARKRPIDQMGAIDRNVLRLAVYELRYGKPTRIGTVVNEAVELARTYGSESSGRFVKGVLSAINLMAAR
ncbi:MAG TPA: transcription antitermination factor NusB [Dehalococcoidia bacterium]|nr:transcription antitermination factor NusB [Dehalococcoidia bacterium]